MIENWFGCIVTCVTVSCQENPCAAWHVFDKVRHAVSRWICLLQCMLTFLLKWHATGRKLVDERSMQRKAVNRATCSQKGSLRLKMRLQIISLLVAVFFFNKKLSSMQRFPVPIWWTVCEFPQVQSCLCRSGNELHQKL